jgi:integrase
MPRTILTKNEVLLVLKDLERRSRRSINSFLNLIIFRLATCCGLRRKEISELNIGDVKLSGERPVIRIRKAATKGKHNVTPTNPTGKDYRKARRVPLWWDKGTLQDLMDWKRFRNTSDPDAPFICSYTPRTLGARIPAKRLAERWPTAIRVLGPERASSVSIHCGRHTFISHALHAGRSLVEVRDAAGHASVATTSIYLHAIESENVPDLFAE